MIPKCSSLVTNSWAETPLQLHMHDLFREPRGIYSCCQHLGSKTVGYRMKLPLLNLVSNLIQHIKKRLHQYFSYKTFTKVLYHRLGYPSQEQIASFTPTYSFSKKPSFFHWNFLLFSSAMSVFVKKCRLISLAMSESLEYETSGAFQHFKVLVPLQYFRRKQATTMMVAWEKE